MLSKRQTEQLRREYVGGDKEDWPRLFAVLGDENRWRIFMLLLNYKDLCVTDLANILEVSVPAVSQQLKIMEMGVLVVRQRDGQKICYQVQRTNGATKLLVRMVAAWKRTGKD